MGFFHPTLIPDPRTLTTDNSFLQHPTNEGRALTAQWKTLTAATRTPYTRPRQRNFSAQKAYGAKVAALQKSGEYLYPHEDNNLRLFGMVEW